MFCKHDAQGNLRVVQLSADHILSNEDELNRLAVLGVDIDQIKKDGQIGNHSYTRTIGDYHIKGNYKEVKGMRYAVTNYHLKFVQCDGVAVKYDRNVIYSGIQTIYQLLCTYITYYVITSQNDILSAARCI